MKDENKQYRILAVQRFESGESPEAICTSLGKSKAWKYEAKGTLYPALPSMFPNQTHQADFVGPCYLKGPIRFYSLNRCYVSITHRKNGRSDCRLSA